MNVFEVFGFFILGSVFNVLILLIFFKILIGSIRKSLDMNIGKLALMVESLLHKVEKIVSVFEKGGKNE